jgi:hypothetical protein
MSKIHVILSYIVVLLVAIISAIVELPIKIASFIIVAIIYLLVLLLAPIAIKMRSTQTLDNLVEYAFSFKFIFAKAMVNKYIDALGL